MNEPVKWLDYEFDVYGPDADWNEVGGPYVFSGREANDQGTLVWIPFYVGRCRKFSGYFSTHRTWPAAVRMGATHIHAMVEKRESQRRTIEKELIRVYQPPLNIQLK